MIRVWTANTPCGSLQLLEEVLVQVVERHRRLFLHADSVTDHQLSDPLAVDELEALVHPRDFVTGTSAEGARCQEDATLSLATSMGPA